MRMQLPSAALANAGPARAIITAVAVTTARTNFMCLMFNLLYPSLRRASLRAPYIYYRIRSQALKKSNHKLWNLKKF